MVQKYTILKVITRNSSKGFTLLELLIGMIITSIIGALSMQAFINASSTFSKDKKTIDSTQNLSAVLDIIGNDIKQAGENIGDKNFPTIEFGIDSASTATPIKSSKIIVRRALSEPLTLCEDLPDPTVAITELLVTDTIKGEANCKVTQLLRSRSTSTLSSIFDPLPIATPITPALNPLLPGALRNARDYRCQLPDPNRDYSSATTDFCDSLTAPLPKVKVAISDTKGHMFVFNQTGEVVVTGNAADTVSPTAYNTTGVHKKYQISVNTTFPTTDSAIANNTNNKVAYAIGNPIYLIEERVYTLDNSGNLQVSVDGNPPSTLIKRIAKFTVSARLYTNSSDKVIKDDPATPCDSTTNTQFTTNSKYTCRFNARVGAAATVAPLDPTYDWKTLAGVKIELQAKYDGSGQNAAETAADKAKLTAAGEFFPRNVLSK